MPNTPTENLSGITITLQTDEEDNLVLEFPTEILETMGWEGGDTLDIQIFAGRLVFTKVLTDSLSE